MMQGQQKASLTKREKVMLLGVAAVGLFYLAFQFGFMPLYESYNEKTTEYNELSVKRDELRLNLERESLVKANHAEAVAQYQEVAAIYERVDANTDLIRKMTIICTDNQFDAPNTTIDDAKDFIFTLADEEITLGAFSSVSVRMVIDGSYNSLKSLLDAVDRDPGVHVSNIKFNINHDDLDAPVSVSVTFSVTLLNG